MARDIDRIPGELACLNHDAIPAALVSTRGYHCEVWQSAGTIVRGGERHSLNFVVKRHRFACTRRKVRALAREYRELRAAFDEIVPRALFVATRVDGEPNVVVLAEARTPWFDLAQPGNADEAGPLLARMPRARTQLRRFVRQARTWSAAGKVVDLYGLENLVLDRDFRVSYLDSFGVFFYEDILFAVPGGDDDLAQRIAISRARLDYLAGLVGL